MIWCPTHMQWEIWQKDKLIATLWGGASEDEMRFHYRRVFDLILSGATFEGLAHP